MEVEEGDMDKTRKIKKVFISRPTLEGAGVHLRRGFGFHEVPLFDPFLMFDDFRQDDPAKYLPGFPWHPHRGIETITYMIRGTAEHGDSMGNKGVIGPGDVQWMTAGGGIIHQEMPKGAADGRMGGFQLWANLPASRKMMDPRYRDVKKADIPEVALPGGITARVICGTVGKTHGPVRDIVTDPEYIDVAMPRQAEFVHPTKPGHTVFAYVFEGEGCFSGEARPSSSDVEPAGSFDLERKPVQGDRAVVLFADGSGIKVTTADSSVRFLLISGRPLGEPVAWQGPIVMNTQEELRTAFREYRDGTFVRPAKSG
jgi:redox-sensitive bicupin YhaK (pirin superfamily)